MLEDGIANLEALDTDWVGRLQLQEALGVSKTVAWRILRKCGAEDGPGNTLLCPRPLLIARLRALQNDGGIHQSEIKRRTNLEAFLERIRPDTVARMTPVVRRDQAIELLSTTFRKLPPNVKLTPTSLHIDFFGTEDFLKAVGSLVYALHNDYEQISDFIEDSKTSSSVNI